MMKTFIKDNRGQVLYAVLVAVMFLAVLSMISMGLTLQHYHAAVQKQENITYYYKADAVAELIRIGEYDDISQEQVKQKILQEWGVEVSQEQGDSGVIVLRIENVEIRTKIDTENQKFLSWEVSYHAKAEQTE